MMFFIANWKMNPLSAIEAKRLVDGYNKLVQPNTKVIVCPPSPFLFLKRNYSSLSFGAQNCAAEKSGALTGEVSPWMIKDLGADYVIIGHSERKKYFGEDLDLIRQKLVLAIKADLKPILCLGEIGSAEQNFDEVRNQLEFYLTEIKSSWLRKIIFAYEPTWAISTFEGKKCSSEQCLSMVLLIKKIIKKKFPSCSLDGIKVVYGGSVNRRNIDGYLKNGGVNGVLVGKASLNLVETKRMLEIYGTKQ